VIAVVFLVLAVAGVVGGWGTTLVALDLAAGLMSAAIVVKAKCWWEAEEDPPAL
jgi:hypothetical protein